MSCNASDPKHTCSHSVIAQLLTHLIDAGFTVLTWQKLMMTLMLQTGHNQHHSNDTLRVQ